MQKRLFDIGWSYESKCQVCHKEEDTDKRKPFHCPEWYEVRREIREALRKWEKQATTSKERKWQGGIVTHPPSESQWNRGHFSLRKLESEKHWSMPAEGFEGPCHRGWLSFGHRRKVESLWFVSGAIGL